MQLFRGSINIIEQPQYGLGKKYNDYGMGFYCTKDINLASEWAVDDELSGYANEYDINTDDLSILDLTSNEFSILNWITILLDNRSFDIQSDFGLEAKKYLLDNYLPAYEDYDMIIGYRADDSYFSFAQDFINNLISIKTLNKAMSLGQLGVQYVIKSKKAFDSLTYMGSFAADNNLWYPLKEKRDRDARKKYSELRKGSWQRGETYFMNIIDEEMTNEDVRLRL